MTKFYERWHWRKREPQRPLDATDAKRRVANGEKLCIVEEEEGRIVRLIEFRPDGGVTASVLREDRQAVRKSVFECHAERLFLNQTFDFEYDEKGVLVLTIWDVCSEEGDSRVETIVRGRSTSRVVESTEDPGPRWSSLPGLEDLSPLFAMHE